jgi:DNA-binding NtrC family response regulator
VDSHPLHILVADSSNETLALIGEALTIESVQVHGASSLDSAWELFQQLRPRILLADSALPGGGGLDLMDRCLAADPGIDFVILSEGCQSEVALDAIRRGAYDCLTKPLDLPRLRLIVHALLEQALEREKTLQLEQELLRVYRFEGIIGRSPLMLEVFRKIRRIAPHFRTVLVTGATGTGKELVARALYNLSPAKPAAFAVCNCSALVESLLESELFGYVKGAFTGASRDKQGIFEFANGGVVFLDEVGELPLPAQAKLLRVLQNQEVQRVGSPVTHRVDVRIIAATNRDLRKMVAQGQFREDLFYRLSVVEVSLPSLVQRKEDVPLLLRHFLEVYSALFKKDVVGITRRAQMLMSAHSWPGNVRELENVISSSCIMAASKVIDVPDLPDAFRTFQPPVERDDEDMLTLEELQLRHLQRVLSRVHGNKARAAEILGIGRNTIYQMLSRRRLAEEQAQQDQSQQRGA